MRYFLPALIFFLLLSCNKPDTLFRQHSAAYTGIDFNNKITESDSINSLDMEFLYNGGGVAVGDFNRDGLDDLYFTASQVSNKMYLNEGAFSFKDVTETAGVSGEGRWCNAASVVDINSDGWQDIYVCATIKKDPAQRTNLLYVNQGIDKKGIPRFKEMAKEYNLADTGLSVHAAFFDYDGDSDLDMYLVTTNLAQRNSTRFDGGSEENKEALCDKLFRNDQHPGIGHPVFTNVTKEAGINDDGYGLGIAIADVNADGWKDIYVTNDFYGSDLLYINEGNGRFADKAKSAFKHTSQNAMGNDIADINNDGLPDIISVDMNPEDNYRKKTNMSGSNYFVYQTMVNNGLVLQYVRNTLQLNNGLIAMDTSGKMLPVFSDISFYAGVAETDWSWNPSLADFDNDGFKDLLVTNGYPRDVTDHDFAAYRSSSYQTTSKKELLEQIPQVKIPNYAFRNTGTLQFENVTKTWGLQMPSFSTGAAYADLDKDGDLDYIVNNINDKAFVYENRSETKNKNHFLNIRFEGPQKNRSGLGTVATIYYDTTLQVFENAPYRGYLSTVAAQLHFGVGAHKAVDSIRIQWPDGKVQTLHQVATNQTITVDYKDAVLPGTKPLSEAVPFFTNTTQQNGIDYRHQEIEFIDFNYQKLLPHKFSQFGPSLAAGDINNDGLDDMIAGASAGKQGQIFLQQPGGRFVQKDLPAAAGRDARRPEMMGLLLFDADGDNDLDLYACSGGNEYVAQTKNYQDQFYLNTGSGNMVIDTAAIPVNYTSKSCVKAADFDNDGDLDLFVGGRVHPERYPEAVSSFVYRNDTQNGKVRFTDVTEKVAPFLKNIGLVCDALWTDFDGDGWHDLILAGEWMSLTFLKNKKGRFENITGTIGLANHTGWWNSITAGDFDNDGDMDYVAGNLGLNSFFKGNEKEPLSIYAADFDGDHSYDAIPSLYLPDRNGKRKAFPAHVRDDMVKQMISTKRKFQNYKSYAAADMHAILSPEEKKQATVLQANFLSSVYIRNDGSQKFTLMPLPPMAQMAPLNGMIAEDINQDGFLDILISGNDFGNEVVNGRYDALNGILLLGNGKGQFKQSGLQQSGLWIPGDGKALSKLRIGNQYAVAATQNGGALLVFTHPATSKLLPLNHDDELALLHLKSGSTRKQELYYGNAFLSQSSRFLLMDTTVETVDIQNRKGLIRRIGTEKTAKR